MDRKTWQATVHGIAKSQTRLTMHAHTSQQTFSVNVHIVNFLSFVGHLWYQLHTDFLTL